LIITCDNFFVIAYENEFSGDRRVPQRLVEKYVYEDEEEELKVASSAESVGRGR
jgi:hypothetical protein